MKDNMSQRNATTRVQKGIYTVSDSLLSREIERMIKFDFRLSVTISILVTIIKDPLSVRTHVLIPPSSEQEK